MARKYHPIYTPEMIRRKIQEDDRWLERAVLAIYEGQTLDEAEYGVTISLNGRGYSSAHAKICTYMAKWLLKGNHLSGKFLEKARHIMPMYAKQLSELALIKDKG